MRLTFDAKGVWNLTLTNWKGSMKFNKILLVLALSLSCAWSAQLTSNESGQKPTQVFSSVAAENKPIVTASKGSVLNVLGYTSATADIFIQIFDTNAVPAEAAIPTAVFVIPGRTGGSSFSLAIPNGGLPCTSGIVICNSSTAATKTVGSSNTFFTVTYAP